MQLRLLTAADVNQALPMQDAIASMREAFGDLARGHAMMPARAHLHPPGWETMSLTMPAALMTPERMGAKLLTLNSENPARSLPVIHGLVVMFDPVTGRPTGLLEGTTLTAIRTGAVSGLATDLLARPDAQSVALLGAGAQAPRQLEAVCAVRDIQSARVWSRTRKRAETLVEAVRGTPGFPEDVTVAKSVDDAVADVDVVCTATPATSPLIKKTHVRPGLHINAVGSFTPAMQEFSADVISTARIVVDHRESVMEESGELIAAVQQHLVDPESFVELGALVNQEAEGRLGAEQVTLFKSVGLAVQDLSAAGWALERAQRNGIGTELDLR